MTTDAQVREFLLTNHAWLVDEDRIIEREEQLRDGDVLLVHKIRRQVRAVRSETQWEPKVLMQETPISTTEYRRRRWGPFSWYEKVA